MANAFTNRIGTTAEETVTNAVNLGSDVGVRNIGLVVDRERGIVGKPILVNSPKEDVRIFGGHSPNRYSSYVVENLFNNTGGYPASVSQVRVVGAGSLASSVIVRNTAQGSQTISVQTLQVATSTLKQKDEVFIGGTIEIGDRFIISLTGTDDVGGTPTSYSLSCNFIATTTLIADAISGLKSALDAAIVAEGLVTPPIVAVVGGKIQIEDAVANSPITVIPSSVNSTHDVEIFKVSAGREGQEDVGDWGNDLRVKVYPIGHANGSTEGYLLQVFYKGYKVESFTSKASDWKTLADDVNKRSEFIAIEEIDFSEPLDLWVFDSALSGGVYVAPTNNDFAPKYNSVTQEPEGLALFEGQDVQLLGCPEVVDATFTKLCNDWCSKNLKFYVFSMPYLATESVLESFYNTLAVPDQSFCGGILNWLEVPADSQGNKIWIPAIGYWLGSGFIKKCGLNNGYVWTPPAGIETTAKGVFRITHDTLTEDKMGRFVKKWRCNVIKFVKGNGFCIWSSRTYSTNTLFESIHVRLQTNWLMTVLPMRYDKFIQKLYTPTLKKSAEIEGKLFGKDIYEKGGLEASIAFEDNWIVEMSVDKNNRKEGEVDVWWIPTECIEHIHLRLNRNDGVMIMNF